jgi:cobalt-zinc-cadmium efflux system outer membrane protein
MATYFRTQQTDYLEDSMPLYACNALLALGLLCVGAAGADVFTREQAVHMALERNPHIQAARQEWKALQAQATQARALPAPEAEVEWEGLPGAASIGDFEERNLGIRQQIGWPVEWWRHKQAADLEAESVRWSTLAMAELDIATEARMAYDRVLSRYQVLAYERENVRLTQDFVDKARLRFEAGDVPHLEVLRARVEVGRAAARLVAAENALREARGVLNTLMARDTELAIETVGELAYRPVGLDLHQLKRQALARRPDVLGAERLASARRATQGAVSASLVPDLNVGLFRQRVRQPAGDESLWRVEMGLEIPLWAPFRQRGELAEARAEVVRAEAEMDVVRRQVLLEVENALGDVHTAARLVELFQQDVLREAEQARVVANRSYEEGKATYLEVLEAHRALAETQLEYAQTLLDFSIARTELERAVGGSLTD